MMKHPPKNSDSSSKEEKVSDDIAHRQTNKDGVSFEEDIVHGANRMACQKQESAMHGEKSDAEGKESSVDAARPCPRPSYVKKIEEYWDQEFAENSAALSTRSDDAMKLRSVDPYSKKAIEGDEKNELRKPQASALASKGVKGSNENDEGDKKLEPSGGQKAVQIKAPTKTASDIADEKKRLRRSARHSRPSAFTRSSIAAKCLASSGDVEVASSSTAAAAAAAPGDDISNNSSQRRLPRSIPRPPARTTSDDSSSRTASEKNRAAMLDTTGTLIYASTGEVVPPEECENLPGAFAHIGPDGDIESSITRSAVTTTSTSTGTSVALPRFSVTADDMEHMVRESLKTPSTDFSDKAQDNSEQLHIPPTTTTSRMVSSGDVTAATFATIDSNGAINEADAGFTKNDNGTDSLVNAKMVSDAEPVFYAEDVERADLLYKNKWFLGTVAFMSLGALVALILVLTLNNDQVMQEETRTGDPRCWVPPEELRFRIPFLCYCFGSPAAWVDTMGDEDKITYGFMAASLQNEGVLNVNMNSTNSEWDQGNLYSCDPINQGLLIFTAIKASLNVSQDVMMRAPPQVFVDGFVIAYFYITMGGINWTRSDGWFESINFCDWYGLDCLFIDHFSQLAFPRNNLQGTLPGHMLQHLRKIRTLDFSENPDVVGTIPSELAGIANLNSLDLSNCSLTGTIPKELSMQGVLDSLDLSRNRLTGTIPPELFQGRRSNDSAATGDSTLRFLNLQGNQLTGTVPSEIRSAQRLTFLRLQHNMLSGTLPSELGELTSLELLNVGSNLFRGVVPETMGCLPRLGLLNVYQSGLREVMGNVERESGNSTLGDPVVTDALIPDSFCPQNDYRCNSTQIVESRFFVIDCKETTVDCSCCARLDTNNLMSRFSYFEAGVQLECADSTPEVAIGFDF